MLHLLSFFLPFAGNRTTILQGNLNSIANTLKGQSHEVLRLKSELKVYNIRTIQTHHNIALVRDDTLFSALKKSLFIHQLQGIKCPCAFKSGQKDAAESTGPDALDDIEILQVNLFDSLLPPNGLYLKELPLEYFNWFASLKVVVFKDVASPRSLPVADTARSKIGIAWIGH